MMTSLDIQLLDILSWRRWIPHSTGKLSCPNKSNSRQNVAFNIFPSAKDTKKKLCQFLFKELKYIYIMFQLASVVEGSIDYCTRNVLEMCEMQAKL